LRLSSAWAKKATALRRISLARFNSVFSRSSCLSRSCSDRLTELFSCVSSVRLHQALKVSGVQPNLLAMEQIAAHLDRYSHCCSMTNRTPRSRTSGEYRFGELMTPSSQDMESPVKPGRFTCTVVVSGNETVRYRLNCCAWQEIAIRR